jgi:hypothetical protein
MRFSVLSLLLLTAVVGVAIATVQAAFDPNIGEVLYEIIRLTVVLIVAIVRSSRCNVALLFNPPMR